MKSRQWGYVAWGQSHAITRFEINRRISKTKREKKKAKGIIKKCIWKSWAICLLIKSAPFCQFEGGLGDHENLTALLVLFRIWLSTFYCRGVMLCLPLAKWDLRRTKNCAGISLSSIKFVRLSSLNETITRKTLGEIVIGHEPRTGCSPLSLFSETVYS